MTSSAHDVAAALRERLPGLPTMKLHKLLYYCQAHHLAWFDRPVFVETISAWDNGPVVGTLWKAERGGEISSPAVRLGEAELNTIGYVVSRYGKLTGIDLAHLTHSEKPWQLADASRKPGTSTRIEESWMRDYFREREERDAAESDVVLDAAEVSAMLDGAATRRDQPAAFDDPDEIRHRLASYV